MKLTLTLGKRVMLLVCVFLVGFFVVSAISVVVTLKAGESTRSMRLITILQDIVMFMAPALVTAVLVTRRPATLLCIDRRPPLAPTLLALCVLVAGIPAMNMVIWLNEHVPLPEWLAQVMTQLEQNAESSIQMMFGAHDIPNLIVSIMIVGIFAGLSEELLFRGGLQRLLTTGGVNHHAAIWGTGALFSAMHLQFYGFVPRMLLGVYFGYLLWWTRSLWVPILVHTINNTIYLVSEWTSRGSDEASAVDTIGQGHDYVIVAVSLILVVAGLYLLRRSAANSVVDHAHEGGTNQ